MHASTIVIIMWEEYGTEICTSSYVLEERHNIINTYMLWSSVLAGCMGGEHVACAGWRLPFLCTPWCSCMYAMITIVDAAMDG